jgi:acetyl-CoA acetyltransferase
LGVGGVAVSRGRRTSEVVIVGVGATEQGELLGRSSDEIAAEAFSLAVADAGLTKSDIDGLVTCSRSGAGTDIAMGLLLGLNPAYSATLNYGTCNFSIHLAAMVISAGLASTVALTYGTNVRTSKYRFGLVPDRHNMQAPHGFQHVAGPAALALRRHQYLYGTTEEQFGHIAVNQRANAAKNPMAIFREPLSMEEYLASPYLVEPLRRLDVTMSSDGGVALVMTSRERAEELATRPVHLLGMAETTALRDLQIDDHLMRPWLKDVADRVYLDAGLGPADIDVLFIQDPTAVWVLQMLEWFGFCPVGEAGPFLAEGHTRLDGTIPVNTNGGQLSESYMWGWLHVVELVRQLRGAAGDRQVKGAEVGMYCSTMAFQKGAASIFGVEP